MRPGDDEVSHMYSKPEPRGWALSNGKSVGLALALVLLTAGSALAADGEPLRWGDLGWRVLNIIIFVGLLWKFTGKLIVNYFTGRRQGIKDDLDNLDDRRANAKIQLADLEKRIANLDAERAAILEESRVQAEAGKNAILAEARRQADAILEQARRTAENEARTMLVQVRAQIADEIVDAAEKILESKLDAAKHDKLINNSLTKVVLN